ncbi:MAG: phosphocarrier protein HPr [Candidatus Firestonebacteria bacterium RIFOXYC2_FULL_39_67]|nr:MAG: phosphocarrier protein HPr [Candidatus Firestonebacteria bacterium RIFOXYD2_FULL_39_29]OGF52827.1 MAG: phosphocarrier protein HPr [Candidatus Firestonebacteria bacterium RifOxyC12_full_39_7]OGF57425.1 MAG: phosphocarrier protein HPr [Candidatus Firestonebacteria bacterium RIFOXYC2_FULL_39_67]
MAEIEVEIKNRLGLHLRAAATLVKITALFKSDIFLKKDEDEVNGKSIMGIMTLAAAQGTKIIIKAVGVDEKEALEKIKEIVDNKFGEGQ